MQILDAAATRAALPFERLIPALEDLAAAMPVFEGRSAGR
jgi:hypothetical protein